MKVLIYISRDFANLVQFLFKGLIIPVSNVCMSILKRRAHTHSHSTVFGVTKTTHMHTLAEVYISYHFCSSERTVFEVSKGSEFTTSVIKQEAELTKDMIESGHWKNTSFKPYNFKSKVSLEKHELEIYNYLYLSSSCLVIISNKVNWLYASIFLSPLPHAKEKIKIFMFPYNNSSRYEYPLSHSNIAGLFVVFFIPLSCHLCRKKTVNKN